MEVYEKIQMKHKIKIASPISKGYNKRSKHKLSKF